MISSVSGEVFFSDGLRFGPHERLSGKRTADATSLPFLVFPGWTKHVFGVHLSDQGAFEVEAASDREGRIQTVAVSHVHSFYQPDTPEDSERHAYHVGIIGSDLCGQREFSWGQVLCCLDTQANKDWLVIVYSAELSVPLHPTELLRHLYEYEPGPRQT